MKKCNTILTEKQQKHQHYHLLMSEEILPPDQRREIKLSLLTLLWKNLKKNKKTTEDQGKKPIMVLKSRVKQNFSDAVQKFF